MTASAGSILVVAAISEQIASMHAESYDMPSQARITQVLDDLVVAVLDIELSLIEQRMIDFGKGRLVHELRRAVHVAEAASFKGRRRARDQSSRDHICQPHHIHPPFVAEILRLGRSAEPD